MWGTGEFRRQAGRLAAGICSICYAAAVRQAAWCLVSWGTFRTASPFWVFTLAALIGWRKRCFTYCIATGAFERSGQYRSCCNRTLQACNRFSATSRSHLLLAHTFTHYSAAARAHACAG